MDFFKIARHATEPPSRANKLSYLPIELNNFSYPPVKFWNFLGSMPRSAKNTVFDQKSTLRVDKFSYPPSELNIFDPLVKEHVMQFLKNPSIIEIFLYFYHMRRTPLDGSRIEVFLDDRPN